MAAQGSQTAQLPDDDADELDPVQGPELPFLRRTAPVPGDPFAAGSPLSAEQTTAMITQLGQTTQLLANLAAQQAAQSASSTSASQRAITGREMSKILPKPKHFRASTREQECSAWPSWLWSLEQYLGVLDPSFAVELAALKMSLSTPANATMPETQVRSRQLYAVLAVLIKGRGFLVVKSVADSNGYETLRRLIELYAPQSKSRSLGILTAMTQVSAFKANEALMPQVLDLERVFGEYESTAQQSLQEDMKTALLIRCVPNHVKNQLHAALPEDAGYDLVRDTIFRIERQAFKWQGVTYFGMAQSSEAVPMEIDMIRQNKGKGKDGSKYGRNPSKGKGDGDKGRGGGKQRPPSPTFGGGRDKGGGKGKDGRGSKGKSKHDQGKSKGKGKGDKSQVECYNCGRRGQYASECWRAKGQASVNQVVHGLSLQVPHPCLRLLLLVLPVLAFLRRPQQPLQAPACAVLKLTSMHLVPAQALSMQSISLHLTLKVAYEGPPPGMPHPHDMTYSDADGQWTSCHDHGACVQGLPSLPDMLPFWWQTPCRSPLTRCALPTAWTLLSMSEP